MVDFIVLILLNYHFGGLFLYGVKKSFTDLPYGLFFILSFIFILFFCIAASCH